MTPDLLGPIGGLQFVTGDRAFREAATAERAGQFGHHCQNGPVRRTSASRRPTTSSVTRKKKRR